MKVLVFLRYYLPAYKAGGPLKSLQGLVDYLGNEVEFFIVTSDRDWGDNAPFPNVEMGRWTKLGDSQVFYTHIVDRQALSDVLHDESWDLLYLQSFFDSQFTLKPLFWRKLGVLKVRRVLIAPRGEFSLGALRIKGMKKKLFLHLTRAFNLYREVYWQASSAFERDDILRTIPSTTSPENIVIASDIPPKIRVDKVSENGASSEIGDRRLRIVYLSRLARKKNLKFALEVLADISFPIEFNIFGPIDDREYWQTCERRIESMPNHIEVNYQGSIPPDRVLREFASHDLFFFPTSGENFGHVVYESLQSGCAVLTSDQTPWQNFQQMRVGWILPLSNPAEFGHAIAKMNAESEEMRRARRRACAAYAEQFLSNGSVINENREMFKTLQTR